MSFTYNELLEFTSIQKYLDLAIGKKKSRVSDKLTLEDKIKEVKLSQYLRGVNLFFEFSKLFNDPSEIIDFWKKYRNNDDKIQELFNEIDTFLNWLKKIKVLEDSTCIAYQAHIRGFLTHNNIRLIFKNYKSKTNKRKQQKKLGITLKVMKKFAEKVKKYIKDLELRLLIEFEHRTGLAFKEIADITFGTLRAKDYNEEYIPISDDREKSTVEYWNYISPTLKEDILDFLRKNQDKSDEDKIFGNDTEKAYQQLNDRFNTAYLKCCKNHFPRFLKIKTSKGNIKKLFSLHSFRAIFKTTCDILKIIPEHRDLFIAHTSEKMTNYDLISDDLLSDYKLVESELFDKKASESATIDQVFDILKELVQNKGKTKAIFRKYNDDPTIDITNEIKGAILIEQLKYDIKKELKKELFQELR